MELLDLRMRSSHLEADQQLVEDFINIMCSYTALLMGAAICQTRNPNGRVYPIGQGWYLAEYLPEAPGRAPAIIAQRIVNFFNQCVLPTLPTDVGCQALTPANVLDMSPEPSAAKSQCSLGAIRGLDVEAPAAERRTLLGITCAPKRTGHIDPWWKSEQDPGSRVEAADDFDLEAPSPGLIVDAGWLGGFLRSNWAKFNTDQLLKKGVITTNLLEYLLSQEIGRPSGGVAPAGLQQRPLSARIRGAAAAEAAPRAPGAADDERRPISMRTADTGQ
jgi:hypothetical protein